MMIDKVMDSDGVRITLKDRSRQKAELQANNEIQKLLLSGYRFPRLTQKTKNGVTTITIKTGAI